MEFLKEFGVGNFITIGLALLGGFSGLILLKGQVAELKSKLEEVKSKAEKAAQDLTEFKIQAAEKYVSVTAMREFKTDIANEIKEIEHTVRGLLQGKFGRGQPS